MNPPRATAWGDLDLFADLDLRAAGISGGWAWMNGPEEDTLQLPLTAERSLRRLRMPLQPRNGSYNFVFELWLATTAADAAVVLPAGNTCVALMLDYFGSSGLDLIRGEQWE